MVEEINININPIIEISCVLLREEAKKPTRATQAAAGCDLYSCEDILIPMRGRAIISTGVAVKLPPNTYGMIAGRSGLAFKRGIIVFNGTIDSDYRGELKVLVFNTTDNDYYVKRGDRIAQMICHCIITPTVTLYEKFYDNTERGSCGFGSSGQ